MPIDFSYHGHDQAHDVLLEARRVSTVVPQEDIAGLVYVGCCCGHEAGILSDYYVGAEVHAIESVKETYDRFLADPVARSCCAPRVKAFNLSLWNSRGAATLYLAKCNTQHSLVPPLDWPVVGKRTVQTTTLLEHCASTGITPDMIVLDAEGAAARVLLGAGPEILSSVKVVMAETEPQGANVFRGGDTDEFVDRLLSLYGMERFILWKPEPPVRQLNSVWIRSEFRKW